jgi:hypothetical protein
MQVRKAVLLGLMLMPVAGCGQDHAPAASAVKDEPAALALRLEPTTFARADVEHVRRTLSRGDDNDYSQAFRSLVRKADAALEAPILTVMDKTGTAVTGDKHEYSTIARYYWPDRSRPAGTAYVYRDGFVNPEIHDRKYDKTASEALFSNTSALGLAYALSGDERYAQRVVDYVRAWFITPATRVNPRLSFAQLVPYANTYLADGVIEFARLIDLLDAVALVRDSAALTGRDQAGLALWLDQYYAWLKTEPRFSGDLTMTNNVGTWTDAQTAAIALVLGRQAEAQAIVRRSLRTLLALQFDAQGKQTQEAGRVEAWHYHAYNLKAWFDLAEIGRRVGVDVLATRTTSGASVKQGALYLLPFLAGTRAWIGRDQIDRYESYEVVHRAAKAFGDQAFRDAVRAEFGDAKIRRQATWLLWPL